MVVNDGGTVANYHPNVAAQMDIRPGTILSGPNGAPVTVESLLGRGGFGQVFAGRLPDETRVAVKTVLTAGLDEDELRTLQNEIQHALSVKHPNVVRVLHVSSGEHDPGHPPYTVMEFVEGGNLRDIITSFRTTGTKPTPEELRGMYLQIAEGMAAVNEKLVHRDLKPENVLVDAAAGRLKIADFGLAKLADAATRTETFKGWGTRPYQAPEAFEFGPNTIAMDVYAAGVLFFELAAISWPIQPKPGDNSPFAWRNAHLLSPPADLRGVRPDLPQDLVQLIMLMLQKDPRRRPVWNSVIERLKKIGLTNIGRPDVSALVQKATATLVEMTDQEARAREERELQEARLALLESAFQEPVNLLRDLVDSFNQASEVGKLTIIQRDVLRAEVHSENRKRRLVLSGSIVEDLDTRHNGIYRIVGMVRVEPTPFTSSQGRFRDPESFGGFNLAYRVAQPTDRFGDWIQLRFEQNPLLGFASDPRWFAVSIAALPEQLRLLNAIGEYQHEKRSLDEEWFKLLLIHLL